jgi:GGDEF domain-containing protein
MRNLRRLDITIFLAVITMGDVNRTQGEDFTILDKSMNEFCDMMKDNLRKGDVITRYSPSQFALLLPTVNLTTGQVVLNRLKDKFNEKFPSGRFVIDYKLKPLIEYQV